MPVLKINKFNKKKYCNYSGMWILFYFLNIYRFRLFRLLWIKILCIILGYLYCTISFSFFLHSALIIFWKLLFSRDIKYYFIFKWSYFINQLLYYFVILFDRDTGLNLLLLFIYQNYFVLIWMCYCADFKWIRLKILPFITSM